MEIASANTTQITGAAASASAKTADTTEGGTMIASDFETFLTMLTTQMQNQDPLNPIESTDFAVQLATFSGVEQQVRTNDLLATMQAQLGSRGMADYAGWVGMEVRAVTAAQFENTPITLYPEPASGAERVTVVVRDRSGADVDIVEIPVSDESVTWAGVDKYGDPFQPGRYTFHLQSFGKNAMLSEEQIAIYSEVQELRMKNGETMLVLQNGDEVRAADIDAVRQPAADMVDA